MPWARAVGCRSATGRTALPLAVAVALALAPAVTAASRPATAERAGSAEYLVLELDAAGDATPLLWRAVEVAALAPSLAADALAATEAGTADDRSDQVLTYRLVGDDGRVVYRGRTELTPFLRGEHHGRRLADRPAAGWAIEAARFPTDRRLAVLRLPRRPAAAARDLLLLGGAGRGAVELGPVRAAAGELPHARIASDARRQLLHHGKSWSADPRNRVNLLIIGDGYTAAEEATFADDAARLRDQLLAVSPYDEYAPYVDVATLFVPSAESGADHPAYRAGCTTSDPTCCADPDAQGDPLAGTFRSTALGARYCAFGLQRLLVVDAGAAVAAASAVPDWDFLLVVVNDTTYGGSGGFVSVVSNHPAAVEVARHEYGHSFTDLADEYETPFPGFPMCSDRDPGLAPCEANVTDETIRSLVKWEPWILPATPVPTPAGTDVVGLFEGARYLDRGMYRPRHSCMMRALGVPFCEICRQAYVDRLYDGGWGIPTGGIDPIEPGSERPPPGPVPASPDGVTFTVELLTPRHPLTLAWSVDGASVPGASGPSLHVDTPAGATRAVELAVIDPTPFVHPALRGEAAVSTRRWVVGGTPGACRADDHTLCLLGGRYRAVVDWENQYNGRRGRGLALPQGNLTGFFAFDDRENVELMLKLVDFGDVIKLFYGQLTDLRFALTLTDTATGEVKVYRNGPENCGAIDQAAFPKVAAGSVGSAGTKHSAAACVPGPQTLCLLDGRFRVEVAWRNQYDGSSGAGAARSLGNLAGLFSFGDPANVELLTKTLDFGDRILFIYGALSDLEYTIEVTDTVGGARQTYHNPAGRYCGAIDPDAF